MTLPRFLDTLSILLTLPSIASANPVLLPPRPYLHSVHNWNTTSSRVLTSAHDVDNTTYLCGSRSDAPIFTLGDEDVGGPGMTIHDADFSNTRQSHYIFFYENARDETPWKYTLLHPGKTTFISVCPTFSGRIVRGSIHENLDGTAKHNLGTWVEVAWEAHGNTTTSNSSVTATRSWGDVSLLEGCDGGVVMLATDGSGVVTGFSRNILKAAPEAALARKTGESLVLGKTVGSEANLEAMRWELKMLDPLREAFIVQDIKPVIVTENGRWDLTFYAGIY
ncbi:hypothetical protein QBC40DRAFT_263946 [Triangularia verruculosa]|uniref:Uncharacterized protein n=1 Tax=Triangularia verruculosa TaxID=2587418 RepID=A0AAN7AUJ7_9PEZI|nr:hypothetical protein QBC40DRAFT_263946 [Triangularia verruculosa]